jgi:hypothetical protein
MLFSLLKVQQHTALKIVFTEPTVSDHLAFQCDLTYGVTCTPRVEGLGGSSVWRRSKPQDAG